MDSISFLQGKSWYTRWLHISTQAPVFTRFFVEDFLDLGGHLTITVGFDEPLLDAPAVESAVPNVTQVVKGCLSHLRPPRLNDNGDLVCDNREATFRWEENNKKAFLGIINSISAIFQIGQ